MADYDVVVVGAGPAGSTCAMLLARSGAKVLLVDKATFPRDKVCGDSVGWKALETLKVLGVEESLLKSPHASTGLAAVLPSGQSIVLDEEGSKRPGILCMRRIFDNILFQKAKETCDTEENFTVSDVLVEDGRVTGVKGCKDGERVVRAKVVVGADGSNSVVSKRLGLGSFDVKKSHVAVRAYYENVRMDSRYSEVHVVEELMPGYFWIFPVGNNVFNVGLGVLAGDVRTKKLNLAGMLDDIVKTPRFAPRFSGAKKISVTGGWMLATGVEKRRRAGDGFLVIGDAAALIDPLSGAGIDDAVNSAAIAAEVIATALRKNDFSYGVLKEYEKRIAALFGRAFKMGGLVVNLSRHRTLTLTFFDELLREKELIPAAQTTFFVPHAPVLKRLAVGARLLAAFVRASLRALVARLSYRSEGR